MRIPHSKDLTLASGKSGFLMLLPLLGFVVVLVIIPLINVVNTALAGSPATNFAKFFESPAQRKALLLTFSASFGVSIVTVSLGAMIAWWLATSRRPFVRAIIWASVLAPFWMGVVIKNYALVVVFAKNGPINYVLGWLGIPPSSMLYTIGAVVVGMTYSMMPYAVLPLYAGFRRLSFNQLRAAESLGATRLYAWITVVLPAMAATLFGSLVIVFVISLGFYITPVLLGGLQVPFMATLISQDLFQYYNLTNAAVSSTILIVSTVFVLFGAILVIGWKRLERAIL